MRSKRDARRRRADLLVLKLVAHVRGNVIGYIALFVALGGTTYAATGDPFILGNSNSASSKTSLSAPIADKALQLTNTSTGTGATALGLKVASGHAPFTVNSETKVTNLNADKLDGRDSAAFLDHCPASTSKFGPICAASNSGGSNWIGALNDCAAS